MKEVEAPCIAELPSKWQKKMWSKPSTNLEIASGDFLIITGSGKHIKYINIKAAIIMVKMLRFCMLYTLVDFFVDL